MLPHGCYRVDSVVVRRGPRRVTSVRRALWHFQTGPPKRNIKYHGHTAAHIGTFAPHFVLLPLSGSYEDGGPTPARSAGRCV